MLCIKRCALLTGAPLIKHKDKFHRVQHINAKGCVDIDQDCWTQLLGTSLINANSWRLGECTTSLAAVVAAHEMIHGDLSTSPDLSLVALDLSWHDELNEDVVCQVLNLSPMITCLKFRACETIGSTMVMMAARSCSKLRKVNVARCNSISNASIVALANHCRELRDLNVSWSLVADEAVLKVLKNCTFLTHLSIQGCKMITANGIATSMTEHVSLQWLDASWANDISEKVARQMVTDRMNILSIPIETLDYYGESMKCSDV
tara:strand:+ start:706 stop:1491 length:786 start_codon:yes stop_codon:yes gene_type:complete